MKMIEEMKREPEMINWVNREYHYYSTVTIYVA